MNVLCSKERADQLRLTPSELALRRTRRRRFIEALCDALRELGAKYVLAVLFQERKRYSHESSPCICNQASTRLWDYERDNGKTQLQEHQGVASFGYCPASTIHPMLFELNRPLDDLQGMLLEEFAGRTLTTQQIYDRHNVGRPYTMKNYRAVLLKMEESRRFLARNPPAGERRKGTFSAHGTRELSEQKPKDPS